MYLHVDCLGKIWRWTIVGISATSLKHTCVSLSVGLAKILVYLVKLMVYFLLRPLA